jgi:hypothetical protein
MGFKVKIDFKINVVLRIVAEINIKIFNPACSVECYSEVMGNYKLKQNNEECQLLGCATVWLL